MAITKRKCVASGLLLGVALLVPGQAPRAAGPGRVAPDPLSALNGASRAAYARAKEEALSRCGPIVLVQGDDLVLRHAGRRTRTRVTPALYHDLKAVSHVPLAVHALLAHAGDGELGERRLGELRRYREKVVAAEKALAGRGFSEAQRGRQARLLRQSRVFLDAVLRDRRVVGEALRGYVRRVRPLLDANAAEAARAQLDALHRQMADWKTGMTAGEWGRLRVVVMGSALPRKDNLAVQFFARLLGEAGEGRRIVYAEGIFDEGRALGLLATHLADTEVGADFFDDPRRMHRDLLADAARDYLDELFRKGGR
jgi:hypothetical protein